MPCGIHHAQVSGRQGSINQIIDTLLDRLGWVCSVLLLKCRKKKKKVRNITSKYTTTHKVHGGAHGMEHR